MRWSRTRASRRRARASGLTRAGVGEPGWSNGTLRCYAPGHAATSSDHGHHVSGQDDAWVALAPGCTSSPVLIPSTDWGSRTPEGRTNTYLWDIQHPKGYANAMGRYRTKRELAFLLAHVTGERQRVLDVGGGSGRFALPLAERGHDVTVVDISEDALRLVRGLNNPRISTRHADFLVQTFENAFDVAIAIESIQYFTLMTLEGVFAKIRSVLRPGGRFVFTELNSQSWRYALHALRGRHTIAYNVAGPNDYQTALRKAGFELLSVEGFVWMPFTVSSNSRLVPLFESIERELHLNRWVGQSPWLLIAAQRLAESQSPTRP